MEKDNSMTDDQNFLDLVSSASPLSYYIYNIKKRKTVRLTKDIFTMIPSENRETPSSYELFNLKGSCEEEQAHIEEFITSFNPPGDYSFRELSFKSSCPSGNSCWFYTKAVPYRLNKKGEVEIILGTLLNVTKRFEIDKQMSKYATVIDQSPSIVMLTDTAGNIEYTNPQFTYTTGYLAEEVAGKNPKILQAGSLPPSLYKKLWNQIKCGDVWRGEFINKRKNGEVYWEHAAITAVNDKNGDLIGYLKVAEDISELKKTEEALEKAKSAAEEANKSKNEFLAHMSHEIRTPMNAILGYTQLLKSSGYPDPTFKNYLERIELSGSSLLKLITDILDLSKLESHKMELHQKRVNMHRLCEEIQKIFSIQIAEKGLGFNLDIDESFPHYIFADEIRLRQILFNLVGNAIKFTDFGSVTLKVKAEKGTDKSIDLVIIVKDTGIGISVAEPELFFDTFFHPKSNSNKLPGGSGLGLAITKRLVELMNGKIELESEQNIGSTFKIYLEKIKLPDENGSEPRKEHQIEEETEDITFNGETILLAEDNSLNRLLINSYLENYDLSIVEAENGEIAIEKAKERKPDIILMDIKMPVMNGYQASKVIRKTEGIKDVPIIFLSATQTPDVEIDDLNVGNGFLLKPVSQESILQLLKTHLKKQEPAVQEGENWKLPEISFQHFQSCSEEIIKVLRDSIGPEFERGIKIMNNRFFKSIASRLKEAGAQSNSDVLINLGKKLAVQADTFNTNKIREVYNYFTKILEILPK